MNHDKTQFPGIDGPEAAFDRNKICSSPQKAIHVEWEVLDHLFTNLLSSIFGKELSVETGREDYYYWKIAFINPITEAELELLFVLAQASDYDREANANEGIFPVFELDESLCNKLVNKLLPFELTSTRADDEGVWFIGE